MDCDSQRSIAVTRSPRCLPRAFAAFACFFSAALGLAQDRGPDLQGKLLIGSTADVVELSTGLTFLGRTDTGAASCSIHAEQIRVKDPEQSMLRNIGKEISFTLLGPDGKKHRVTSQIASLVRVKTSEKQERRYKVWLTLRHQGVERKVHVSLNDRSHMQYPLLIGRNFLTGKFVVDVAKKHSPSEESAAK